MLAGMTVIDYDCGYFAFCDYDYNYSDLLLYYTF